MEIYERGGDILSGAFFENEFKVAFEMCANETQYFLEHEIRIWNEQSTSIANSVEFPYSAPQSRSRQQASLYNGMCLEGICEFTHHSPESLP